VHGAERKIYEKEKMKKEIHEEIQFSLGNRIKCKE